MKWCLVVSIGVLMVFSTDIAGAFSTPVPDSGNARLSSRIAISGGMGVEYLSAPDVVDYVNTLVALSTRQRVSEFNSAVQFFGAFAYPISSNWVLKAEYVYLLGSYNPDIPNRASKFLLIMNMPSVILQYVLWDEGLYNLKVGGGLGVHFASLTTQYFTIDERLRGSGLGILMEAEANTAFGEHLFAFLGVDLRWEFVGTLNEPRNAAQSTVVLQNMYAFGVGARLGFSYFF